MNRQQGGYTLLELMAGIMILGFLSAMAVAAVARAISDIGKIHLEIQKFLTNERRGYPASLADLGLDDLIDPWGNPYQYLVVDGLGNNGAVRKDKNLIPVNRSYDVYSMGKDGNTASPFTSTVGQDDVVLAGDGTYFGLAADF
jgi:general secretion pathway protein G